MNFIPVHLIQTLGNPIAGFPEPSSVGPIDFLKILGEYDSNAILSLLGGDPSLSSTLQGYMPRSVGSETLQGKGWLVHPDSEEGMVESDFRGIHRERMQGPVSPSGLPESIEAVEEDSAEGSRNRFEPQTSVGSGDEADQTDPSRERVKSDSMAMKSSSEPRPDGSASHRFLGSSDRGQYPSVPSQAFHSDLFKPKNGSDQTPRKDSQGGNHAASAKIFGDDFRVDASTPVLDHSVLSDDAMTLPKTESRINPPADLKPLPSGHAIEGLTPTIGEAIVTSMKAHSIRSQSLIDPASTELVDPKPVLNQLAQKLVHAGGKNGMSIQFGLEPEWLGPIRVDLLVQNQRFSASITASNSYVRDLLEVHQELLRETLSEYGYRVDRFVVSVGEPHQPSPLPQNGSGHGKGSPSQSGGQPGDRSPSHGNQGQDPHDGRGDDQKALNLYA